MADFTSYVSDSLTNAALTFLRTLDDSFSDVSNHYYILPGFCDVHVHFREPGFSYKETIKTGTLAAARGGYTAVCTMPNLNPVPDDMAHLQEELDLIQDQAIIPTLPYGALTVGEKGETIADLEAMADQVVAFSDDGCGIQSETMMRELMVRVSALDKILVAHCEENALLHGGYIHDCAYAKAHHHRGICSESEWKPIERDLALSKATGCEYHVCHISTKESVALIRQAKAEGVKVTCETAPHYLTLSSKDLQESGRYKMNPPLRDEADRLALIEGIMDGTIDMIATDHAPHSEEEKSRGLEKSPFGVVGLETAFPVLYTKLVKPGIITMEKLLDLMVIAPRKRFSIPADESFSIWEVNRPCEIDVNAFRSKGRATPFAGERVYGKNLLTYLNQKRIYQFNMEE